MADWIDFGQRGLGFNLALFAACALVVWIAGTRVARDADRLANMTGIGHATVGLVVLAAITSLPEIAVALTSAAMGSPPLSVNNLVGAVAMQVALLAVADAIIGKEALTVVAGSSALLLLIALATLMLTLLAAAVAFGDTPLAGAGVGSWALLATYALAIWTVSRAEGRDVWVVRSDHDRDAGSVGAEAARPPASGPDGARKPLLVRMAAAAAAILVAGFLLSRIGDALARQTGLGESFVGAVLLAFSTSLPEVSAVYAAVRIRRYQLAIGDIFGTGMFNVALVFAVDAVYRGPPVLGEVGRFALCAALLAALMSCIYLAGMLERRDRTIARMGIDSFLVLAVYAGGLVLLYQLR